MEFLELLSFYHWVIIAFGFLLLRVFKLDGLAIPGTFAGVMVAVATFISPDIYWGWQIWGFVFITAISAIPYLRQQQLRREEALDVRPTQADEASLMIGTTVTLEQPLAPGQGKLLIKGKYWRVAAKRDFPAGTILEVTGHQGAVLNITSIENPSYGINENHSGGEVPVAEYDRDPALEGEYGHPNFDAWVLFQAASKAHSKQSLIQVYHLLCALRGQTLADAKAGLNTHTLALYDSHQEGRHIEMYPDMYCDARHYNFYYGEDHWVGSQSSDFEQEMRKLEAALDTPWADLVRGTFPLEQAELALRTLREKG